MQLQLNACKSNAPLGAVLVAGCSETGASVIWGSETLLVAGGGVRLERESTIIRHLARCSGSAMLYGSTMLDRTQVDHWISLVCGWNFVEVTNQLEKALATSTYLVGEQITAADLAVWAFLKAWPHRKNRWETSTSLDNSKRWFKLVASHAQVSKTMETLPADVVLGPGNSDSKVIAATSAPSTGRKEEGKFVDLPGAEKGKVIVRFPPEASGYLHIGHAKAALLNQYYQQLFEGTLIMRFDDTNPAKENAEFERVILEDLKLLQVNYDKLTHTSDHFDLIATYCEQMLRNGQAYVDDTEPELMKQEREQKVESKRRTQPVSKNMEMWEEMKRGTEAGQKCCVRAKIDMKSVNGCMRDPTMYRCKPEPHVRTGFKYKVYPTYDFACPIVDSVEGVTHALRTTEYHDRDEQYYWFIEALGLRKPYIWEYARLSMTNTVLSKRKLTWFVQNGHVDGWDDPRFPTVRGVIRHGMTVDGLKQFIIAQGSSRSVVQMEWDKIWAINKKVIDPVAPRYTALEKGETALVRIRGVEEACTKAPLHPKNPDGDKKDVWLSDKVLINKKDVAELRVGQNATFINWGNIRINDINTGADGCVVVEAEPNVDDKDYKKTPKLTWLAETAKAPAIPCVLVYFDHIISKPVLGKDEDFKSYINNNTRTDKLMLGDPELARLKKGDIIQLQRIGFFICDSPYQPRSAHSCVESPVVLFFIPDGKDDKSAKKEVTVQVQAKEVKKGASSPVKAGTPPAATSTAGGADLDSKLKEQGEKVRQLKAQKAAKADVDAAVKELLSLKAAFKAATGADWKPDSAPAAPKAEPVQAAAPASDSTQLGEKIQKQGDLVRDLKAKKSPKADIDAAVKELLSLKAAFKAATGADWKPESAPAAPKPEPVQAAAPASDSAQLGERIQKQGDLVRDWKAKKSPKADIDAAVKELLSLKAAFKAATGADWKPDSAPAAPKAEPVQAAAPASDSAQLGEKIQKQGDLVRDLKAKKSPKADIDAAVKELLSLKAAFKAATGADWKPAAVAPAAAAAAPVVSSSLAMSESELLAKVDEQGAKVRSLKADKAPKDAVDAAVAELLALKAKYKELTGKDVPGAQATRPQKKDAPKKKEPPPKKDAADADDAEKKQTKLGLDAKKEEKLSDWYSQVITKAEMIEYYDVSGCYILRPWSYAIWETIKDFFDAEIKKLGVKNCYFPMFVSNHALEKEKTHIADFAPEVAWVTKSGSTELAEPIAIRPTSETVMYPAYAKWIQSHRDLPLKLNQWNNVVRWEFKHPQPFLRTREFLWQEGHTAFADKAEAEEEVYTILDLYRRVYTDLMAIPVVKGRKTEKEKFAGGDYTTTVEAFVAASGRGIQGATSHHLGQNFSKMFDIVFEDPKTQEKKFVYQNSWGITTRTIGVMVMVHSDNQGLVLPPNVAPVQVVIVPCGITVDLSEEERVAVMNACRGYEKRLRSAGVRVEADYRDNYSPGWKFNHWELKGVPVRLEVGPKDVKKDQYVTVRRDTGEKKPMPQISVEEDIAQLIQHIHQALLKKATDELESHTATLHDFKDFVPELDKKKLILAPFCGGKECEERIKKESAREDGAVAADPGAPAMGAKSLCIPLQQPAGGLDSNAKCIHPACKDKPQYYCLFGRSY